MDSFLVFIRLVVLFMSPNLSKSFFTPLEGTNSLLESRSLISSLYSCYSCNSTWGSSSITPISNCALMQLKMFLIVSWATPSLSKLDLLSKSESLHEKVRPSNSGALPNKVNVLPLPVWPYVKIVVLRDRFTKSQMFLHKFSRSKILMLSSIWPKTSKKPYVYHILSNFL